MPCPQTCIMSELDYGLPCLGVVAADEHVALDLAVGILEMHCGNVLERRYQPHAAAKSALQRDYRGPAFGQLHAVHLGRNERHRDIHQDLARQVVAYATIMLYSVART